MHCNFQLIFLGVLTYTAFLASSLSLQYSTHLVHLITTNNDFSAINFNFPPVELNLSFAVVLGCFICCLPLQYLGRRSTLEWLSAPLHILGCCLIFTFHHSWQQNQISNYTYIILILGMCMQGISSGLTFVASPIYILEAINKIVSPSTTVGILLLIMQMPTTTGLLMANIFPITHKTYFQHLIPAVINMFSLIGFKFVSESPGKLQLKKYHSRNENHNTFKFKRNYEYSSFKDMQRKNNLCKENVSITSYFHTLLIAIGLCSFWYLHGVHIYNFYASWTLKFSGISVVWKLDMTLLSLCIRFSSICILIALYLIINNFSFHSTFLTLAGTVVTLSLIVTGLCFYSLEDEDSWVSYFCWLPLSMSLLFQCAFWLGFGSQGFILAVVICPQSFQPSIFSIGAAIFWLGEMFSSRLVVFVISTLHPFGSFWFFSAMSAISLIFVKCSVFPELYQIPFANSHKHFHVHDIIF